MSAPTRRLVGALLLAILIAGGIALLRSGVYGWTVFVVFPVMLGGLGSWVFRPTNGEGAVATGAITVAVATCSLLILGLEGVICVGMALPLTAPLGALGGWLMYHAEPSRLARGGGVALLLLLPPAGVIWDTQARPPVFEVRSTMEIDAPPERVWKYVVSFPDLPEPREWFFRAGLAYPRRARIEGTGVGAVRYCEFSTGPFVEPIEIWDEPRLLRFRVTENPAPMHEWSPYAQVAPKHLHGYLISQKGQFRLTRLSGDRTLLEGATWYRHGLWPAEYWRWWSDAIIHRIHLRVLNHIRTLAEAGGRG
jgi:polyketide cyclase/dehydrase/lipid transport protein